MERKAKIKDWVRALMEYNPSAPPGGSRMVVLTCAHTAGRHVEHIRQDWWDDDDFRCGYEELRADSGLLIVS
jgi:hypothetical protein